MIVLRFEDLDLDSWTQWPELESPGLIQGQYFTLGCEGHQIFEVNGVSFSNYLALPFFAAQLASITRRLKAGANEDRLTELDSPWVLTFRRDQQRVKIEQGPLIEIYRCAEADLEELSIEAEKYLKLVFEKGCELFPPMSDMPDVREFFGLPTDG